MSSGEFDLRSRLRGFLASKDERPQCSRAQCEAPAVHRIEWRNPRIHDADRVKIWLACDEHLDFLLGFLESRRFPVRLARIDDPVNEEPIE
jgi:hypothetical protein